MKENFSWKRIVIILLVGISIWILIPKIIGLRATLELLKQIKYWAFILAIIAEGFFYIGSAIITRTVLQMTNDRLKYWDVLKISLMDSFSVQFLPLGSFGEAAIDYYFFRAKNIRTSHIVLMFVARTIIVWLVFAIIYLVGVAFSPINPDFNTAKISIIWIIYFAAFGFLFYLIYLYSRKERLLSKTMSAIKLVNRFARLFHLNQIDLIKVPALVDKVYEATAILGQRRNLQISALLGALSFWFGDIFCLYFSFLAFGFHPHFAIVIFAYAITRILSTISFIPGGIGISEASMSLIFIGFGVPAPTALAAVLIFRLLSFWLPIPIGLSAFLSLQREYSKMRLNAVASE